MGAYLTLDISDFQKNLVTAGQQLENFKSLQTFGNNGSKGLGADLLNGLTAPFAAAGRAAEAFARQFGASSEMVRSDARITGSVIGGISHSVEHVGRAFGTLPEEVHQSVSAACSRMQSAIEKAGPGLYSAAKKDGQSIVGGIDDALGGSSQSGGMAGAGKRAVSGLRNGLESGRTSAVSTIGGIMRGMLSAAKGVDFSGVGRGVIGGILSGLNQRKSSLLATAGSVAAGVANTIRNALKVNSPSKVMIPVGESITEGMELGLTRGSHALYETASAISEDTAAALSGISVRGMNYSNLHSTNYSDRLDRLLDAVEKLADSQTTMEIDGRPFGRLVREYV